MTNAVDIERAVSEGLETLRSHGHFCDGSAADLELWFCADTPYPDIGIEDVIRNPFLVVHEIVEIDEVKKMGLDIGRKDVIISNMELVDRAHLKAAQIEMEIAYAMKNRAHLAERVQHIIKWSKDALVESEMRTRYAELHQEVKRMLIQLDKK
ncbi:MAG: hypothetical protein ABIE25_04705 [Thermoplasmatota archaeon]|nr:hypothetical protein [Candidatus Thermoplasmatota archaeon]